MDPHANFAYSTVATAPSPSLSGTSLVLAGGTGALMPAPPFDAVAWPPNQPLPLNGAAEIVRVTGVSTDTLTIVRGPQASDPGGINATIGVGWQIMAALTRKTLADIEGAALGGQILGAQNQSANAGVSARSNLGYLGVASHTDGALAGTGVCCAVAVPVVPGDVITTVSVPIGGTAASTPTHAFAALYSGIATPASLGQSTDTTTAVIAANARLDFTLASAVTITNAMAPFGYVYASVSFTASAIPTALGVTLLATSAEYPWFTHSPLFFALTHGSAVAGTAPPTIASPSVKAFCPYVFLS